MRRGSSHRRARINPPRSPPRLWGRWAAAPARAPRPARRRPDSARLSPPAAPGERPVLPPGGVKGTGAALHPGRCRPAAARDRDRDGTGVCAQRPGNGARSPKLEQSRLSRELRGAVSVCGRLTHLCGPAGVGVQPGKPSPQSVTVLPVCEPVPPAQCHDPCVVRSLQLCSAASEQVRFGRRTHMAWLLHPHNMILSATPFSQCTMVWSQYLGTGWHLYGRALCEDSTCEITRIQETFEIIKLEVCKNATTL